MNQNGKDLSLALTAPFPPDAVRWVPLAVKGNRALVAAYLDARAIMHRLDTVFGVGGWSDSYEVLSSGSVVCTLAVKVENEWVHKMDVGSPSSQPDDGDKLKAALSLSPSSGWVLGEPTSVFSTHSPSTLTASVQTTDPEGSTR